MRERDRTVALYSRPRWLALCEVDAVMRHTEESAAQRIGDFFMKPSFIKTRLADEWFAWKLAWDEVWREVGEARQKLSGRQETILVPLEEYCTLLEARAREMKAYELLGEAQEQIRVLKAGWRSMRPSCRKRLPRGTSSARVLIDQMTHPGRLVH